MPSSIEARTRNLILKFGEYIQAFADAPAFNNAQLDSHLATVALRSRLGSAGAAACSPEFASLLYKTLELWRMNVRRARLAPFPTFQASLQRSAGAIATLESASIEDDRLNAVEISNELWRLMDGLRITETRVRLVAATKALHHLLPNLVVPMDRQFTGAFFDWNTNDWQAKEEHSFKGGYAVFSDIARRVMPSRFVGSGWNTSPSKVLDNAVVGYCRVHLIDTGSRTKAIIARAKELGILDEITARAKAPDVDSR